jgi:hypothetical protein
MFDDFLEGIASDISETEYADGVEPAAPAVARCGADHNRSGIYHTTEAKTKMALGRAKMQLRKTQNALLRSIWRIMEIQHTMPKHVKHMACCRQSNLKHEEWPRSCNPALLLWS